MACHTITPLQFLQKFLHPIKTQPQNLTLHSPVTRYVHQHTIIKVRVPITIHLTTYIHATPIYAV